MKLAFEIAPEHLLAGWRAEAAKAKYRWPRRRTPIAFAAFGWAVGMSPALAGNAADLSDAVFAIVVALAFFALAFAVWRDWPLRTAREWQRDALKTGELAAIVGPWEAEAAPQALKRANRHGRSETLWIAVTELELDDAGLTVHAAEGVNFLYLPRQAVSPDEFDRFVAACQERMAASRAGKPL